MIAYPDTSYLGALYVPQSTSEGAIKHYRKLTEPLHVSALLLGEFRQSVRFQIFRHRRDSTQGYSRHTGLKALAQLQANLEAGALVVMPAEWADVLATGERLSSRHTPTGGHRFIDLLHVASALHFGARDFLSFDQNQRKLAAAEGLAPKP